MRYLWTLLGRLLLLLLNLTALRSIRLFYSTSTEVLLLGNIGQ